MTAPERHAGLEPKADERPWEGPGAVRRDCAPHRGSWFVLLGLVDGFGIAVAVAAWMLSYRPFYLQVSPTTCISPSDWLLVLPSVLCLPLGLSTWALAARDLARMRGGDMDPAGLGAATLAGWAGIASMAVGAIPTLLAVLLILS
jgi:hypothetical protein